MRGVLLAAGLGLAAICGAESAGAAMPTLSAEGKCVIEINSGGIGAGEECRRLTLRENPATGEIVVSFDFASGMAVEFEGPGIRVGSWLIMSPGRMRWNNADGKTQTLSNPTGEPNLQITGRCANALQAGGTQLYETYCKVQTPMGEINLTFKIPRGDK